MSNTAKLVIVTAVLCALNFVTLPSAEAAFDSHTVAFYPFNEGAAGESAVGRTLYNLVDPNVCTGYIEKVDEAASVTFSDECPGKYIFTDFTYGVPAAYTNAKSLYFTGGAAKMFIDELCAKALELGRYKIEFWYKYDTDAAAASVDSNVLPFATFCGGWNTATETNIWLSTYVKRFGTATKTPYRSNAKSSANAQGGRKATTNIGGSQDEYNTLGDSLKDGKWHHQAIIFPYGSVTSSARYMNFVGDHLKTDGKGRVNIISYLPGDDVPRPFIFNEGGEFRGWISCLRMTDGTGEDLKKTTPYKALHPSKSETCVPRTIAHYRFENGENGAEIASAVSDAERYSEINTQLYYRATSVAGDTGNYRCNGTITSAVYGEVVDQPTFTNDVRRKFVRSGSDESTRVTNALAARFVSPDPVLATNFVDGAGIRLADGAYPAFVANSTYTVELFVKFDYDDWKARVGDVSEKAKRVALAWGTYSDTLSSSYAFNWQLFLNLTSEASPKLGVDGYTSSGPAVAVPNILDGKWHHIAVTIDPPSNPEASRAQAELYFDYAWLTASLADNKKWIYYYSANAYKLNFYFLRGDRQVRTDSKTGAITVLGKSHAFNGLVDEIRISHGLLAPSEFLVQKGEPGSMVIVR